MSGIGEIKQTISSYKWKIANFYDICQTLNTGDCIRSPNIKMMDGENILPFFIRLFPNGDTDVHKDFLTLNICYRGDYPVLYVPLLKISILNDKNMMIHQEKMLNVKFQRGRFKFISKFVERNFLLDEKNCALVDGTLVLQYDVIFDSKNALLTPIICYVNLNKNNQEFEKLLDDSKFSDVRFIIEDQTIYAHKVVLISRSKFFEAMFVHQMKENDFGKIEITDVKYEVMKELLRFIYASKVNEIEKVAKDLLIAADKYGLDDLKILCENSLFGSLNSENALEYLILTNSCNTIQLKSQVIQFVEDHPDIVEKPEFKSLHPDIMYEMVCAMSKKRRIH